MYHNVLLAQHFPDNCSRSEFHNSLYLTSKGHLEANPLIAPQHAMQVHTYVNAHTQTLTVPGTKVGRDRDNLLGGDYELKFTSQQEKRRKQKVYGFTTDGTCSLAANQGREFLQVFTAQFLLCLT